MAALRRHVSYANVVSTLCLFVVLGGTSYAVATGSIDSREIKNNTVSTRDLRNNDVRGGDVRNEALTGSDVKESTLGTVPAAEAAHNARAADRASTAGTAETARTATTAGRAGTAGEADNAAKLGGTPLSGLLRVAGCQSGKINGFARVLGVPGFPSTYSTSSAYRDTEHNCSGGPVEVRRVSAGAYYVRFVGNPAPLAVVSTLDSFVNAGVIKITEGPDAGAFLVTLRPGATNATVEAPFTIVLP